MTSKRFFAIQIISLFAALAATGCATNYRVDGVVANPNITTYNRMAVVGLTPEQEQILMAAYIDIFPERQIVFIERQRLQDIIAEQDLQAGRLDEKTRAAVARILGVEGIIFAAYQSEQHGTRKIETLRLRIIGAETAEIVGSTIITIRSTTGVLTRELATLAVLSIRRRLDKPGPQDATVSAPSGQQWHAQPFEGTPGYPPPSFLDRRGDDGRFHRESRDETETNNTN